jgi:hypothetical protein
VTANTKSTMVPEEGKWTEAMVDNAELQLSAMGHGDRNGRQKRNNRAVWGTEKRGIPDHQVEEPPPVLPYAFFFQLKAVDSGGAKPKNSTGTGCVVPVCLPAFTVLCVCNRCIIFTNLYPIKPFVELCTASGEANPKLQGTMI